MHTLNHGREKNEVFLHGLSPWNIHKKFPLQFIHDELVSSCMNLLIVGESELRHLESFNCFKSLQQQLPSWDRNNVVILKLTRLMSWTLAKVLHCSIDSHYTKAINFTLPRHKFIFNDYQQLQFDLKPSSTCNLIPGMWKIGNLLLPQHTLHSNEKVL